MYTIKKSVIKGILQRKFSAIVAVYLEQLEGLVKKYDISEIEYKAEKAIIQKITYEAMREIEHQIDAFSQGVSIGIDFIRPTKD
ncbi:MAG: hypothetical protein WC516_05810 [Patescibacteria group bacterium]